AREVMDDDAYRALVREAVASAEPTEAEWRAFSERVFFHSGDFSRPELYLGLNERLAEVATSCATRGNLLYYLAVPPAVIERVVEGLGRAGLLSGPED